MTYRQRANTILGLSFVCFIAIFLWWYTHDVSVWEELLFFVIQSALIGSIADWFAVTALFEKPLGFPYHTELLYRHRDEIIDSMTKIISEKLLQPNMWQDKLYQISFIDKLVGWLRGPNGREKFRSVLYEVAQRAYRYAQKGGTQADQHAHHQGPLHEMVREHIQKFAHFPPGRSEQPHVQRCHRPRAGTGQQ